MSHRVLAVYMTFPDSASADATARALVDARLAACVNVLPAARSYYRWDGEVHVDDEVVAVAKTTRERLDALTALVLERHPFELPCVVAYPADGGLVAYLDWVADETRESASCG